MSLKQLLGWKRTMATSNGRRTTDRPPLPMFEPLENRLLLSASPFFSTTQMAGDSISVGPLTFIGPAAANVVVAAGLNANMPAPSGSGGSGLGSETTRPAPATPEVSLSAARHVGDLWFSAPSGSAVPAGISVTSGSLQSFSTQPAKPPTEVFGQPVVSLTWQGKTIPMIQDSYDGFTAPGVDFAKYAAANGLKVSNVVDYGNNFYGFTQSALSPDQMSAWANAHAPSIVSIYPNIWAGSIAAVPNVGYSPSVGSLQSFSTQPAKPPTEVFGQPVVSATWQGKTIRMIRDSYGVFTQPGVDFAKYAAANGLQVSNVVGYAENLYGFTQSALSPDQMSAWARSHAPSIVVLSPNQAAGSIAVVPNVGYSPSVGSLQSFSTQPAKPPTEVFGQPVVSATWQGKTIRMIKNSYGVITAPGVDFAKYAAANGLQVSNIVDYGDNFYGFTETARSPDQMSAWVEAHASNILSFNPNEVFGSIATVPNGGNLGLQAAT